MKKISLAVVLMLIGIGGINAQSILIEAESFTDKGGWVVDPQFVEQMGSPYLLAHGMGKPVKDASTAFSVRKPGLYYVWVRTKIWVPGNWDAPGRFKLLVDGQKLERTLGLNPEWNWEYAGEIQLGKGTRQISLQDLTGFEGMAVGIFTKRPESDRRWRAYSGSYLCIKYNVNPRLFILRIWKNIWG